MPHASFIAARVSWTKLKASLEARGGTFGVREIASDTGATEQDSAYVGEYSNATYILDDEMIFSLESSPDLFANISRELNTLMVVFGYETVSGTYAFLAVENGLLTRYFSSSTSSKEALDMGSALPTEAKAPLASVDGLMAAARHLGFDVAARDLHTTKRVLALPEDQTAYQTEDGPLGLRRAENEHREKHGIAGDQWMAQFQPQVTLSSRPDGWTLHMEKKPWHQRLREWFQR